jgi:hypothetical protein
MSLIKNGLIVIIAIFIALVLAEIMFRVSGIGYGHSPIERSRSYHHVHPANYSYLVADPAGEYGGFQVSYDDSRYRVASAGQRTVVAKDKTNSIIFLGDSFTEGNQVEYEETFVSKVGSSLGVGVLNMGVSSYSPLIYLLQIEKEILKSAPNLIVMQIFSNDFASDTFYSRAAQYSEGVVVNVDGGRNDALISFLRHFYVVRFLRKSQLLILHLISNKPTQSAFDVEQNVESIDFQLTVSLIQEAAAKLHKANKKLLVFMIPSKSLSLQGICCDGDLLYSDFTGELERRGIAVLDVRPYFSRYPNQQELFFQKDIHLTSEGHTVVAQALLDELL